MTDAAPFAASKEAKMSAGRPTALFRRLLRDDGGATSIEYALLASGIGCAVAVTIFGLGTDVRTNLYDKLANLF